MVRAHKGRIAMFQYQDPAFLAQDNPDQNTWYEILSLTTYARIYDTIIHIADTNETLEIRITIDGVPHLGVRPATACINYRCLIRGDASAQAVEIITDPESLPNSTRMPAFLAEGHEITIELRKTTNAGVGTLSGVTRYGRMIDIP